MPKGIHVHVWDKDGDQILEEYDLELITEYDDHYQYGMEFAGRWLEIRVWKEESK